MKLIAPDYYPQFRCIADKCGHSCCIGWEIDVDPETRERYRHVPGPFGERLNACIDDGEVSTFRLGKDERCPMLAASGLCDLITALGEDALCQICADHPRFRSFFTNRTEIGLGLCCEEAARIVLTRETPMRLICLEDDGEDAELPEDEAALLALRGKLIAIAQDTSLPLDKRLDALLDAVDFAIPDKDWAEVYRRLERIDPTWDDLLDTLQQPLSAHPRAFEAALAHFIAYLLYRHIPGALADDDIPGRVGFCVLSTRILAGLCAAKPECTTTDLIEFARMYSAEIEYDEDNIAALLDALWEVE